MKPFNSLGHFNLKVNDLQASIDAYERGVALKKHCEAKLKEAQARIEKITVAADGAVMTSPLT